MLKKRFLTQLFLNTHSVKGTKKALSSDSAFL